jgi:hypothetical protein
LQAPTAAILPGTGWPDRTRSKAYVTEICALPAERSFPEIGAEVVSYRRIKNLGELKAALRRHDGPMDRPRPSPRTLESLGHDLLAGHSVYEFTLRLRGKPSILQRPPHQPLVGLKSLTLLTLQGTSWRPAYRAAELGMLDLVESTCQGRVYRYAVLNEKAAWWSLPLARYERVENLPTPWFKTIDVRLAAFHGELLWRHEGRGERPGIASMATEGGAKRGKIEIFTDIRWLRWAARQRNPRRRELILQHMVTG